MQEDLTDSRSLDEFKNPRIETQRITVKTEEGGPCPCCGGKLMYPLQEFCCCHINPPCSFCTSIVLTCDDCEWEEGMEIELNDRH